MTLGGRKNQNWVESLRDRLTERISGIDDPRVQGRCLHSLADILILTFCALLCGAEKYTGIRWFGITRRHWLEQFLDLSNGIPSDDTIRRVLGLVDPVALEKLLRQWAKDYSLANGRARHARVSMDGKSLRGTEKDILHGKMPLHLINVYDHGQGIVLAQHKASGTGLSEVKAALECLELLDLRGSLVSMDAGLASVKMTSRIREKKADYVIPIKLNERNVFSILEKHARKQKFRPVRNLRDHFQSTEEHQHGRDEKRECAVARCPVLLKEVRAFRPEVKTIFQIHRRRQEKDKRPAYIASPDGIRTSQESCFYISSRELTATECLKHVREHWQIENQLHWSLDVSFGEDSNLVRDKRAARNLSALRKIAFNLFATVPIPEPDIPEGTKVPRVGRIIKMQIASLDPGYLELLLQNFATPQPQIQSTQ